MGHGGVIIFPHACLCGGNNQMLEVTSRIKGCVGGKLGERDFRVQDLLAQVDLEDLLTVLLRWKIDKYASW